ncbi:MAG: HAD family hydrolase [Candidatus Paceibacteria bacterium]
MDIDALMFDYDGTLTKERHTIPENLQQTLRKLKEQSYTCTLNTGTPYPMLSVKVGEQFTPNASMILEVGGRIVDSNGVNCYLKPFAQQEIAELDTLLGDDQIQLVAFTPTEGAEFYVYTQDIARLQHKYRNHFPEQWIYHTQHELYEAMRAYGTVRVAIEGVDDHFQIPVNTSFSGSVLRNGRIYELTSYGVNKGEAIHRWAKIEHIAPSRIAIFGDNFNDLDMFRQPVGMKVQVGDSCPELTPYATHHVEDAEELDTFLQETFLR